jgi:hypothetical protein
MYNARRGSLYNNGAMTVTFDRSVSDGSCDSSNLPADAFVDPASANANLRWFVQLVGFQLKGPVAILIPWAIGDTALRSPRGVTGCVPPSPSRDEGGVSWRGKQRKMGSTGRAKKLDSNPRCTCGDWGASGGRGAHEQL